MAQQHSIRAVPHYMLYDERGKLVKQGYEVYRDILSWKRKKTR